MPGRWVLVGVSVLGLAIAACAPGPTPIPSFSPPPLPAEVSSWADFTWKDAVVPAVPPGVDTERFVAAAARAVGFVAVGYHESGPDRDGIIRFSPDGSAWTAVGAAGQFVDIELVDVDAGPDGFVAIGVESGPAMGDRVRTVVFRSADGRVWEADPPLPAALGSFPNSLAASDAGIIATGFGSDGGPIVWLARDGRAFERVAPGGDGAGGIVDPRSVPSGFVALGADGTAPRLLRSTDGIDWAATSIDGGADLVAYRVVPGRAATIVQGAFAPGCGPFAACGGTSVAWWSDDGETWVRLPDAAPIANAGMPAIAAGPHGFIVVDGITAWSSPDGWHWRPLPEPGDGSRVVNHSVVRGDVIVAVGEESFEDGSAVGRILVGR